MKRDKKRLFASIGVIIGIVIVLLILAWVFGLFGGKRGISLAPGDCFCDSCESCNTKLRDSSCKFIFLNQNITRVHEDINCLWLSHNAHGRIFDCLNNHISGYTGMSFYNVSNLTIRNCALSFWAGNGIEIYNFIDEPGVRTSEVNLKNISFYNMESSSSCIDIGSSSQGVFELSSITIRNYTGNSRSFSPVNSAIIIGGNSRVILRDISICKNTRLNNSFDIMLLQTPQIITQSNVVCDKSFGMNCSSKCPINMPGTIFVTSTNYQGNLGGIAGADAKCMARAQAGGLTGNWVALLSNSTLNMTNRIPNMTYKRMDGKIIANNKADLFDGSLVINGQIDLDEFGRARAPSGWSMVWTGTYFDGKILAGRTEYCSNWKSNSTSSSIAGRHGHYTQAGMQWISGGTMTCNNEYPLYCMRVN